MTRHGTLAYYLAAWVIGCPVVALVFWLIESVHTGSASSSALLEYLFLCPNVWRFGFTPICFPSAQGDAGPPNAKRRTLGSGGRGAVACAGVLFVCAGSSGRLSAAACSRAPGYFLYVRLCSRGRQAIWNSGWWQAPIEGAGIAAVLCLVDRAFNRVDAAPETGAPADKIEKRPTRVNLPPE